MSVIRSIKWTAVGILGRCLVWVMVKSSRITVLGKDDLNALRREKKPVIHLIWHGRMFLAPYFFRNRGSVAMVSPSEDGEIVVRIASGWGYKFVRGSSSHSIVRAWVEMKRALEKGGEVTHVADGPKGPSRKMKMGAIKLAQQTGAYLVPFTFSATKKKVLNSWDKLMLFYPFGKLVIMLGKPMTVPPDIDDDELEKERKKVEDACTQLESEADRYFDRQ